ncbi:MAG: hypothetical protein RI935_426 [Candidatus Parcubacteria bacterium]|jgi:hypothetical protein
MKYSPYTSVWGYVTHVALHQKRKGCILVTIAGRKLCFDLEEESKLQKLGLLRLSRSRKGQRDKVFLLMKENQENGTHHLMWGWNNPNNRFARLLQNTIINEQSGTLVDKVIEADAYSDLHHLKSKRISVFV